MELDMEMELNVAMEEVGVLKEVVVVVKLLKVVWRAYMSLVGKLFPHSGIKCSGW